MLNTLWYNNENSKSLDNITNSYIINENLKYVIGNISYNGLYVDFNNEEDYLIYIKLCDYFLKTDCIHLIYNFDIDNVKNNMYKYKLVNSPHYFYYYPDDKNRTFYYKKNALKNEIMDK